jgi:hypothetical protein
VSSVAEQRVYVEVSETSKTDVEITELRNIVEVSEDQLQAYVTLAGQQGAPGSKIISGSGTPGASVGVPGDIYIDTDNPPKFYGPKTVDSGWPETPFFTLSSNRRFVYEQAIPSSTWSIAHDLGGYPSVSVVDSAKTQVVGEVTYIDEENIVVEFSSAFAGLAFLT